MPDLDDVMHPDADDPLTPDDLEAAAAAIDAAHPSPPDPLAEAPPLADLVGDALDTFRRRREGEEKPIPLPWPKLGQALNGGLWPGLYVLVGPTGSGKSQLALQAALHAAEAGTPVLYVGLELGAPGLVARLLGLRGRRRWSEVWLGEGAPPNVGDTAALRGLPFHLDMGPPFGWSYDLLPERVAALVERYGRPPLVVLDFLQLVQSPEGAERQDLRERIGRASYAARQAARAHGAAVILVSSTARQHYGALLGPPLTSSGRPKMNPAELVGLGKESGETEYSADVVLVVGADSKAGRLPGNGRTAREWSWCWLAVAKLRAGNRTWCPLLFNGGWMEEPDDVARAAYLQARGSGEGSDDSDTSDARNDVRGL